MALFPHELLSSLDAARLWPAPSGFTVPEAYARALEVRSLRSARGETPRGYKIGFTNRGIWPRYQVFAPIWGTVYDSTLSFSDEGAGRLSLAGTCQPRIEPECVFGFRATPPAKASLASLLGCIAWMAPGFEVVQSHRPDWIFTAADAVADGGLHARLLVGQRVPVALPDASEHKALAFDAQLAGAQVSLRRGEQVVETGQGSNVLDGPLHALLHFVRELRQCPGAPELQPGDVVTTGTWTDAWPVSPGQRWSADFGAPLSRLDVTFDPA